MNPDGDRALRDTARVGEFFDLTAKPSGRGWFPLRELVRSPAALDRRVVRVRRALARQAACAPGDVPLRTAASVDLLGLSARVLSPALGCAALTGTVLTLTLDTAWYEHGPPRLATSRRDCRTVTTAQQAADLLHASVIATVLDPLVEAYASRFSLSHKVLWGNVASALNGALDELERCDVPQVLPAREIVVACWQARVLATSVRSTAPRFVRNSCCLYYRIPGAGVCGDCLLSA